MKMAEGYASFSSSTDALQDHRGPHLPVILLQACVGVVGPWRRGLRHLGRAEKWRQKLGTWGNQNWLVVYLPLWKIWVRQSGLLFPIYNRKIKNVSNHHPENDKNMRIDWECEAKPWWNKMGITWELNGNVKPNVGVKLSGWKFDGNVPSSSTHWYGEDCKPLSQ